MTQPLASTTVTTTVAPVNPTAVSPTHPAGDVGPITTSALRTPPDFGPSLQTLHILKDRPGRWTPEQVRAWYDKLPWLVGANYLPSNAVNALECWQADTFSPALVDRELGWAADLGFTSMRVFLHDLVWKADPAAYLDRIEIFLTIAAKHRIGVLFVFFDSCWHPFPHLGPQREPEPGVHNSYWVQSPGVNALRDPALFLDLEPYVTGVVQRFRDDPRVHGWDIWNEPDNANVNHYGLRDIKEKAWAVLPLLELAFRWARQARPTQPLTSGIWWGDWTDDNGFTPLQQLQLANSDFITFHNYQPLAKNEKAIAALARYGRPVACTEYMARGTGSTFDDMLPYFRQQRIGAYCWGFVAGKSQTYMPWDSWQHPYPPEPPVWFHDILRADGTPYRAAETELIRSLTRANTPAAALS